MVNTRKWLPGRKVLISPDWFDEVDWAASEISCSLTSDAIKESPEYNPAEPVNREYEEKLYDYYGRPKYWISI